MTAMPYVPGLDGLRALAIALVMFLHAGVPGFPGGNVGVDVFLVLSGFLITTLLLNELESSGRIDLSRFYWRRMWRLMPPLLLLLLLYMLLAPLLWPDYPFHVRDVLVMLLYMANLAASMGFPPEKLMHGWSLGLEEQFYLLWPLVLGICWRLPHLWRVLLIVALLLTGWRYWCLFGLGMPSSEAYYRPDLHASGLMLGAALAAAVRQGVLAESGTRAFWLGCAALLPAVAVSRSGELNLAVFVPLTELAAASMILAILAKGGEGLRHPALVHVGRLSYGLYLFHYPIMKYLTEQGLSWYWVLLLGGGLSYLMAWISYHSIERYARQRRQRYVAQS